MRAPNRKKNNKKLKIGIVINYKNAEKKKDEYLNINSKDLPWLKLAHDKKYSEKIINIKKKKYVPYDIAIGLYIEYYYPNAIVDYITPEQISKKRFKQNDLVFIVIYDLLESFHLSNKMKYKKFKNALKTSGNVYPPYEYQKFINNKCTYYKYLSSKNITVAPTYCVTKQKWYSRDSDKYVKKIIKKVNRNKWKSIITKPVLGQEAIGFGKYMKCKSGGLECRKKKLIKYFNRNVPKYKSIVIQEYIPGFDEKNHEIRCFFINGKYKYSMITSERYSGDLTVYEGGKVKIPRKQWRQALFLAKKTVRSLPKLNLPGMYKHSIITRVDIGTGLEGAKESCFVNEVEFVPSLFVREISHKKYPIIKNISESIVNVAQIYRRSKRKY